MLSSAWMLSLWYCRRQTGQGINARTGKEECIIARGSVVTYAEIAEEINSPRANVRKWMARLIEQKYIRTERDRRGIRIFVLNPKKFRVSMRGHSQSAQSAHKQHIRVPSNGHSQRTYAPPNKDTYEKL